MKIKNLFKDVTLSSFIIAIVSLLWFLFRSGPKPNRVSYPCQQAAASNVKFFFLAVPLVYARKIRHLYRYDINKELLIKNCVIVCLLLLFVYYGNYIFKTYSTNKEIEKYELYKRIGTLGKLLSVTDDVTYATIPHALALDSPHRVVSVHNSNATSWNFSCTGTGTCPYYYGDYVDQAVVDAMIDKGLMELTKTGSVARAWRTILPNYQPGQKIAIKVNFNNAGSYDDSDNRVDALPQIINSVARSLKQIGIQEENISVYDTMKIIPDRFRSKINYRKIKFYDKSGGRPDTQEATFNSADPTATIDFSTSGFSGQSYKITDVLVDAHYLINIPIFKRHSGARISLALKNHFGSIKYPGAMHPYIYPSDSTYSSKTNPLIDINSNPHIKNKTVLIIGDGLYGSWPGNRHAPIRWSSFNNDSPNILFFGVDPIAADSVMFDYLAREGEIAGSFGYSFKGAEDILILGAQHGLGVHERWNNNIDRKYTVIDYIEIDIDKGLCKRCSGSGRAKDC